MSELHSAVVALVMIKRGSQTIQTEQTAQTIQTVQLFCLLFLNCDLHMIKVRTPFSYFGNVATVSNFLLTK